MDISSIDLNLLVALDVLLRERNVTNAGRRLGLSQPAMSNVLARLRTALQDPVLLRTSQGMLPTTKAQSLVTPVRQALSALQQALSDAETFEPSNAQRQFKIALVDATSIFLVPQLATHLEQTAPGIDLELLPWSSERSLDLLETGQIDCAITVGPLPSRAGLYQRSLFYDSFVSLVRKDHPTVKRRLTLKRFIEIPHVLVAPFGTSQGGLVDHALGELGKQRRVAVVVPHFAAAPFVVAQTNYVVTLSKGVADVFLKLLPLRAFKTPVELSGGSWNLVWHERTHKDPAHEWFRQMVAGVADSL